METKDSWTNDDLLEKIIQITDKLGLRVQTASADFESDKDWLMIQTNSMNEQGQPEIYDDERLILMLAKLCIHFNDLSLQQYGLLQMIFHLKMDPQKFGSNPFSGFVYEWMEFLESNSSEDAIPVDVDQYISEKSYIKTISVFDESLRLNWDMDCERYRNESKENRISGYHYVSLLLGSLQILTNPSRFNVMVDLTQIYRRNRDEFENYESFLIYIQKLIAAYNAENEELLEDLYLLLRNPDNPTEKISFNDESGS